MRTYLTPRQVLDEKILPVGRAVLYRELHAGSIPHRRLGKKFIISRVALIRWLENRTADHGPEAA